MILYPSVDDLLKQVNSRYSLIMLASKRAHELDAGAPPMLSEYKSVKTIGRAMEEIAAGDLMIDPDEIDED
ncbi:MULTISPECIES: DNA-directed RNA polymerase subunit omega [Lactiplantibacillus]|jgi:DNA-directed RNA polymerase subunit omega|uniref:DNA-directed RNA polymerase subunit omega n=4 Tax=Lactiplantibacillus pentosus TaxID=1589 RepID=A0A241RKU5_LACPE|nr:MULTISPECIES: DNA-directed RNA polymerase subunit omega [Lactiplantibacillus]EQM55292.1 DNA-directed RNA polymerase subunit omega [Lactiplantibacillus plantarum EGD-AQ4]MCH4129683.1 DNA-directed RNA polymerase subunit omega [Lactiplantibacillus sp.]CCC15671.1 DNA-directed RNA polymerase subunit omega (RNAP omega subunit) [Lactiplantibacillus pentosus IG1]BBM20217.1 DNA-directed RNA polymerase subunit omega [Lactiplantibacillus plantarum]ASG78517.1 DNA-directed RNA polymerase subunit omega [